MKTNDSIFSFENLEVWKCSRKLVVDVYSMVKKFPAVEKFALCDQLRRAIVSVSSNIAEGNGRTSPNEKVRFIEIAYGSLLESYCQLLLAADLDYITVDDLNTLKKQFELISKMLIGLRAKFKK
ncbi:MAG: four helix bundle protein [Bacteroidales bacterium]|nr:four helix bundle protein [Bacteroidales bacterium]